MGWSWLVWLNEKYECLKTSVRLGTIWVKKGLFTNGCKKTLKFVQTAHKITQEKEAYKEE